MASDLAEFANSIIGGEDFHSARSSGFFDESSKSIMQTRSKLSSDLPSSSSIVILGDQSQLSRDVDRWINGESESTTDTPANVIVQGVSNVRITSRRYSPCKSANVVYGANTYEYIIMVPARLNRPPTTVERVQPPVMQPSTSFTNDMWCYVLALLLPVFSFSNCANWTYNPGLIVNTAELFVMSLSRVCTQAHARFLQLAQDRIAREFVATIMDIMLVVYAIGFLVLSMYQASVSI
ncbi:uncharacterized protein LOC113237899 isoform X2 [Hyposmocoma kahamanoa]|uniref:uncharacterized protein LOC113237899 isoform X2 n=1 Tax=Hyposmocoma kahamanoa TaxID=1477025 RepID=UPI000E6D9FD4|nr:uncharacterized protein LOC113237899 isoform X2 [Hyposmocoma kahamanoa]